MKKLSKLSGIIFLTIASGTFAGNGDGVRPSKVTNSDDICIFDWCIAFTGTGEKTENNTGKSIQNKGNGGGHRPPILRRGNGDGARPPKD